MNSRREERKLHDYTVLHCLCLLTTADTGMQMSEKKGFPFLKVR